CRRSIVDLARVRIETTERTEKDLPLHSQDSPQAHHLCDLLELIAQAGSRIQREWRDDRIACGSERCFNAESFRCDSAGPADESQILILREQILHGLVPSVIVGRIRKSIETKSLIE